NEPFGIVIIEAMALGKPVIASNAAGPTEIISPGIDGLLTPFGNAAELASAVLRYFDDGDFRNGVASAARRRALDFSTYLYAKRLVSALSQIKAPTQVGLAEQDPRRQWAVAVGVAQGNGQVNA